MKNAKDITASGILLFCLKPWHNGHCCCCPYCCCSGCHCWSSGSTRCRCCPP